MGRGTAHSGFLIMAYPQILIEGELRNKPIEIDIDPAKLTVGDLRLMKGYIAANDSSQTLALMGEFLIKHTDWTEAEVNQLTVGELVEAMGQVRRAEENKAVPLVSNTVSSDGHATVLETSLNGQTTSPTPSNLDATPKMSDAS